MLEILFAPPIRTEVIFLFAAAIPRDRWPKKLVIVSALGYFQMSNILRFVQFLALGIWLGSIIYFSFAVAPALFSALSSRDQAGAVVGIALGRLHHLGIIAGILYLVAALGLAPSPKALVQPAALAVIAMLLLTVVSQHHVIPRMAQLRTQMVSVDATPPENPLRAEFDRLHKISVRLEGSTLLLGLVCLFLTARTPHS
jgi:uncharacterized membrane protein